MLILLAFCFLAFYGTVSAKDTLYDEINALFNVTYSCPNGSNDPEMSNSWHLFNSEGSSNKITRVYTRPDYAWVNGVDGKDVLLSYVTTGVNEENEDIKPNLELDYSHNYLNATPSTEGTSLVALGSGVACNGYCSRGVAFNSKFGVQSLVNPVADSEPVKLSNFIAASSSLVYSDPVTQPDDGVIEDNSVYADIVASTISFATCPVANTTSTHSCTIIEDFLDLSTSPNVDSFDAITGAGISYQYVQVCGLEYQNSTTGNVPSSAGCSTYQNPDYETDSITGTSMYLYPAGNNKHSFTNYSPICRSPSASIVTAMAPNGKRPDYAPEGSSIMFSMPSSGKDRTGSTLGLTAPLGDNTCAVKTETSLETGAAMAIGAGTAAIGYQKLKEVYGKFEQVTPIVGDRAFPNVPNRRDVENLMIEAAQWSLNYTTIVNEYDSFTLNAGGYLFSPLYGFGISNTSVVAALAENYSPYANPDSVIYQYSTGTNGCTTENKCLEKKNEFMFTIPALDDVVIEKMTVGFTMDLTDDTQITLEDPNGVKSVLMYDSEYRAEEISIDADKVRFLTNAFWGTHSAGTWKVKFTKGRDYSSIGRIVVTVFGSKSYAVITSPKFKKTINNSTNYTIEWTATRSTTGNGATSGYENGVDIWIFSRLWIPIAKINSETIAFSANEYKWKSKRVDLKDGSYGFFVMVPAGWAPKTTTEVFPNAQFDIYNFPTLTKSNLVRFYIEDEPDQGAVLENNKASFMKVGIAVYFIVVTLLMLFK